MAADTFGLKATIRGDAETIEFLRGLGYAIIRGPGGGPVGSALRTASEPVTAAIEQNAPVDTGILKRSLRLSRQKGRTRTSINYGIVVRAVATAAAKKRSGARSMIPFYWYFLEFGWTAKNGRKYQKPFIRPVVFAQQDQFASDFSEALLDSLRPMGFK